MDSNDGQLDELQLRRLQEALSDGFRQAEIGEFEPLSLVDLLKEIDQCD